MANSPEFDLSRLYDRPISIAYYTRDDRIEYNCEFLLLVPAYHDVGVNFNGTTWLKNVPDLENYEEVCWDDSSGVPIMGVRKDTGCMVFFGHLANLPRRVYNEVLNALPTDLPFKYPEGEEALRVGIDQMLNRKKNVTVAKLREAKRSLEDLEKDLENIQESLEDVEFDIAALQKQVEQGAIKNIRLSGSRVILQTNRIICSILKDGNFTGREVDIGEYFIDIDTQHLSSGIRIFKADIDTESSASRIHPHIGNNNCMIYEACLGNMRGLFDDAVRKADLPTIVSLCIEFLRRDESTDDFIPAETLQRFLIRGS